METMLIILLSYVPYSSTRSIWFLHEAILEKFEFVGFLYKDNQVTIICLHRKADLSFITRI